jgi:hypothetical protein
MTKFNTLYNKLINEGMNVISTIVTALKTNKAVCLTYTNSKEIPFNDLYEAFSNSPGDKILVVYEDLSIPTALVNRTRHVLKNPNDKKVYNAIESGNYGVVILLPVGKALPSAIVNRCMMINSQDNTNI